MKVMVTGANGHIGANTVRALLARGHAVTAFVRPASDRRGLEGLDIAYAYGDVEDADSLKRAAGGSEAIVHTAAVYRMWARDAADIHRPAMAGTENIFAAAREAGAARLVYTSSVVAIGMSDDPRKVRTAADWNEDARTPYFAAKTASERACYELADEHGVETVFLLPGTTLGAYDYRITPSMYLLQNFANRSRPAIKTGLAAVDVRDVAAIHALAVDHGTPGERYPIVTQNMTQRELAALVSTFTGKSVPYMGVGPGLAKMAGRLEGLRARLMRDEPEYGPETMDELVGRYQYIDGRPTYAAFGHTPYAMQDTVRDSLLWLAEIGALKNGVAARIEREQTAGRR